MNRKYQSALFLAAFGASLTARPVHGQNVTWLGGIDNSWANGNNWSTSAVPGPNAVAVFNGPVGAGGPSISFSGANQTVGAVEFDTSSAASYDLGTTAGDSLTVNSANISSTVGAIAATNAVANSQEIDASIAFTSASPLITNASTVNLTLGAAGTTATLSDTAATPTSVTFNFTSATASTMTINDAITGSVGGTTTVGSVGAGGTASGGLVISGTSNGAATLILNGQNTYTGVTNVSQISGDQKNPVTILIGSNSAFGNSTIAYNTNGTQDPLQAYNGDRTISNGFNMLSGFTVSNATTPHNLTFSGASTFSSGASRTITVNTFGQSVSFGASPSSNTLTLASSAASGKAALNIAFNPSAMSDGTHPSSLILNDIIQDAGSPAVPDTVSVNANGNSTPMGIIQFNGSNTFAGGVKINGQSGSNLTYQAVSVQVGVSSVGSGSLVTSGPFGRGMLTWNGNVDPNNGSGAGFLEAIGGDRTIGNNVTLTSGFIALEAGSTGNTSNSLTLTGNVTDPNGKFITNNIPSTSTAPAALTFGSPTIPANITGKFELQGQVAASGSVTGSVTNVYDNIIDTSSSSLSLLLVQGAGTSGVTTMNLMGTNTYTGGTTVKSGATLNTNTNFSNGSLTFINGTHGPAKGVVQAQLTMPGATAGITVVPSLSIDAGAGSLTSQLDITNNGLIDNDTSSGAFTTIQSEIKNAATSGIAGGSVTFVGGGITSSTAATVAVNTSDTHKTAVGYATASSLGFTGPGTFLGASFSSTSSVLVRYTLAGDANLDGIVNAFDFNALASNYGITSNGNWVQGDFNYDGSVDSNDFGLIAANFGNNIAAVPSSSQPLDSASALSTFVPEPTSMSLLGLSILALRRRRKA